MQNSSWVLEQELAGPLPRRTTYSRPIRNLRIVLRVLLIAVCSLVGVIAITNITALRALGEHGTTVIGTVTSRYTISERGGDIYHIQYSYRTPASATVLTGDDEVPQQIFDTHSEHAAIAVTYLPERPDTSTIGSKPDENKIGAIKIHWFLIEFTCALLFAGLILLVESDVRTQRKLLQYGDAIPAEIVTLEPVNPAQPQLPHRLRYKYSTPDGRTVEGAVAIYADYAATLQGRATHVTVLVNPRQPRKHKLYIAFKAVLIDLPSNG